MITIFVIVFLMYSWFELNSFQHEYIKNFIDTRPLLFGVGLVLFLLMLFN